MPSLPPSPPSGPFKSDSYWISQEYLSSASTPPPSDGVGLYPVAQPTISHDITVATAMTPSANSPRSAFSEDPSTISFDILAKRRLWLIDLAHDICDPAKHRGSLLVWKEPRQQWCHVATTDSLTASIYRYDVPVGIKVGL